MNSITQDMKCRQSLLTYAQKYGVSRASRKHNKSRSYIYFWLARYDGSLHSLACQSRRPHSHPRQHTQEELKLISDMHRRKTKLEIIELWVRLQKRGYTRTIKSLWRVMRREAWLAKVEKKKPYKPKPYEQARHSDNHTAHACWDSHPNPHKKSQDRSCGCAPNDACPEA